jgi:hypothetical protein
MQPGRKGEISFPFRGVRSPQRSLQPPGIGLNTLSLASGAHLVRVLQICPGCKPSSLPKKLLLMEGPAEG